MATSTLPLSSGSYMIGIGHAAARALLTANDVSKTGITISGPVRLDDVNDSMKQRWIVKHDAQSDTYTIKNASGRYLTPSHTSSTRSSNVELNEIAFQWQFIEKRGYIWILIPNSSRNVQLPLGKDVAPMLLEYKESSPPTNGQCLFEAVENSENMEISFISSIQPLLCPGIYRSITTTQSKGRQLLLSSSDSALSTASGNQSDGSDLWNLKYTPESRTWTVQNVKTKAYLSYALTSKKSKNLSMTEKATHWSFEQLQERQIVGMYGLKVPYTDRMLGMSKNEGSDEISLRRVEDAAAWEFEPVYLTSGAAFRGPVPDGIHAIHARFSYNSLLNVTLLSTSADGHHGLHCRPNMAVIADEQSWRFTREPRTGLYFIESNNSHLYLGTSCSLGGRETKISVQCVHEPQLWQIQVSSNSSSVTIKLPWTEWCITMVHHTQKLVLRPRPTSESYNVDETFEFTMSDLNKIVVDQTDIESTMEQVTAVDSDSDAGDSGSETAVSDCSNKEEREMTLQTELPSNGRIVIRKNAQGVVSAGHSLGNEGRTRISIEDETHAPATKLVVKRGGDNGISVRSKIVTGTNGSDSDTSTTSLVATTAKRQISFSGR